MCIILCCQDCKIMIWPAKYVLDQESRPVQTVKGMIIGLTRADASHTFPVNIILLLLHSNIVQQPVGSQIFIWQVSLVV